MSAIKFGHAPDEVSMSMREGDVVLTFTPDQALDVAAKLAGYAYRAKGQQVTHVSIIPLGDDQ